MDLWIDSRWGKCSCTMQKLIFEISITLRRKCSQVDAQHVLAQRVTWVCKGIFSARIAFASFCSADFNRQCDYPGKVQPVRNTFTARGYHSAEPIGLLVFHLPPFPPFIKSSQTSHLLFFFHTLSFYRR